MAYSDQGWPEDKDQYVEAPVRYRKASVICYLPVCCPALRVSHLKKYVCTPFASVHHRICWHRNNCASRGGQTEDEVSGSNVSSSSGNVGVVSRNTVPFHRELENSHR